MTLSTNQPISYPSLDLFVHFLPALLEELALDDPPGHVDLRLLLQRIVAQIDRLAFHLGFEASDERSNDNEERSIELELATMTCVVSSSLQLSSHLHQLSHQSQLCGRLKIGT